MPPDFQEGIDRLIERFPALAALGTCANRRSVPYVQAITALECGPACLAMTLGYHGKKVTLEEMRGMIDASGGTDAQTLLDAAAVYGLRGRGVSIELDQLEYLEPGSILYWEFHHFVVFERLGSGYVDIVDPTFGKRRIGMEKLRRSFTGVALLQDDGAGGLFRCVLVGEGLAGALQVAAGGGGQLGVLFQADQIGRAHV